MVVCGQLPLAKEMGMLEPRQVQDGTRRVLRALISSAANFSISPGEGVGLTPFHHEGLCQEHRVVVPV